MQVFRFGDGGDVSLSYLAPTATGAGSSRGVRAPAHARVQLLLAVQRDERPARSPRTTRSGSRSGKAQKGARHVQLSRLRGEEIPLPGGGVLLNDCYNANPLSMARRWSTSTTGRRAPQGGRLGDMAELGPGAPATTGRSGPPPRARASRCSSRSVRSRAATCRARAACRSPAGPRTVEQGLAPLAPSSARRLRPGQGLTGDGARGDRGGRGRRRPAWA